MRGPSGRGSSRRWPATLATRAWSLLLPAGLLLATGCPGQDGGSGGPAPVPPGDAPAAPGGEDGEAAVSAPTTGKIELKDGQGTEVLAIKWKDDGAKLVDGQGQELVRLKLDGAKLKMKGPDDQALGAVSGDAKKLKIKDAAGNELFVLRRQDDGDWKLESPQDELLAKIKHHTDGWKIEDSQGHERFQVVAREGKVSLRRVEADGKETPVYTTHDKLAPLAIAALALDALSREQQLALMVRLHLAQPE